MLVAIGAMSMKTTTETASIFTMFIVSALIFFDIGWNGLTLLSDGDISDYSLSENTQLFLASFQKLMASQSATIDTTPFIDSGRPIHR